MSELSSTAQKFILHWGEMGSRWGLNRTVAQIHALLYISEKPLHADDICAALDVARSNVSNSLRELQNWGVVRVVHVLGDRRDHFETLADVFEMFRVIMIERKKREIDPTVGILRDCIAEVPAGPEEAHLKKQLQALESTFQLASSWFDQMSKLSPSTVVKAMKMGDKILKIIG
jgi:DNA-binding transcriptional regulator GbsR (MarR family)